MSSRCWPLVTIALFAVSQSAQGQFIVPYGGGFELNIGKVKKNFGFNLSLSRGYGGFVYGNPHGGFGYPGYGGGFGFTQVQIISPAPVFGPPPIVFVPPPEPIVVERVLAPGVIPRDILNPPPRVLPDLVDPPDRPLPGKDAGKFRPLDPNNREKAKQPVKPADPLPMPPLPAPPQPEADPEREGARQIELGKDAFREKQYGRAAERFRLALDAAPNRAEPHFLLAQVHIALGNYRRAFDAIQSGLRLDPDWPMRRFRPIALYEDVAEYSVHLNVLEDTLAANPDDAVLLYLQAYCLWFDGRIEEALPLFRQAEPALPDPGVIEFFLRAAPGVPIV